ncbi:MAG: hypothetical protein AAGC47_11060 [Bacteroidota bacterium]
MRAFIIKITLFALILFTFVRFIGSADNLDSNTSKNQNIVRLNQISTIDSLDILFLGNSYTYSSIDPEYFDGIGLNTFNLGTASAGPGFYKLLADDYLTTASRKPRLIAICISPTTFSVLSDNFEAYPIHRYLTTPISNEKILLETASPKLYFDLVSKSVEKGIENLKRAESKGEPAEPITQRGFYPSNVVYNDNTYKETQDFYAPLQEDSFDFEKSQQILKLTEELRSQGVKVVFIEMPTHRLVDFLTPSFLREYESFKTRIVEDYEIISFQGKLQNDHFRNVDHMNSAGAAIFSSYLAKQPVFSIK